MTCPFCEIFAHRLPEPAELCYPQNGIACFQPLHPNGEGHRIFVPTHHVESASQAPDLVGRLMTAAARWAVINGIAEYNLITSVGASATQTVPHLHVHLVPRTPHDGLTLPWGKEAHEHKAKS